MGGGGENKKADLTCSDFAQAVVYVHAGERELCKYVLADRCHGLQRHFLVSCVFYKGDFVTIQQVCAYLTQKNAVSADAGLGAVFVNAFCNKARRNRALIKNISDFS